MVALLLQRVVATGRPSFVAPSSSSSPVAAAASATARSYLCASSSWRSSSGSVGVIPSRWRDFSSGSLCRIAIPKFSSFFSGDLCCFMAATDGAGVPEAFGRSTRGVRMMGGGPRTFPGGVSKWQWKRMQEKKERQIEKARLLRERQAYEERRRKELLAASPRVEKPWEQSSLRNPLAPPSAAFDPQVRALADRFRKNSGEDMWTDADGPVVSTGLPSLVSARFIPNSSSKSSFGNGGGSSFDSRPATRASPRSQQQLNAFSEDASHSDQTAERFRGAPRTAVAGPNSNSRGSVQRSGSRRGIADGLSSPEGASSGLRGKLDNLSISRNLSSTSGSAFLEDINEERAGSSRDRRGDIPQVSTGKQSYQRGLARSGSGKRFAEDQQARLMETAVQEAEQHRKKVRQTPFGDTLRSDASTEASHSHLSKSRFDAFPVSPLSIRALHEVMGYERMTKVQEATFPIILEGKDVLAKAKTGTGKTIAFLLPSVEAVLNARMDRNSGLVGRSPINVLIICPTRELASQAAMEAKSLMTYHKGMDAQIVIGGTNVNTEANNLQKRPCQVLVATPGRLLDHMSSKEIRQQLNQLKVLVLDEADRLLDMGFRKDLEKIIKMLPASRQTLLFSATVPNEVHKVSEVALRRDHVFVDTVGTNTEDTHAKVQQQYVIVPLEDQFGAIYTLLDEHMREEDQYKVLVFCTTARCTALMAEFSTKLGLNTLEIHSRKSQAYRTRVSDTFRNCEGGVIMFTSDVSARGVDYPDVTLVIQLGIPAGREEYVHRLGRTGRAGKEGRGVLVLAPWEQQFLKALKDIPITEYSDLKVKEDTEDKVHLALDIVSSDTKEKAYAAWLGYYNSAKMLALNKTELVQKANFFSYTLGMDEPPLLMKKTVGMMGLRGVPGLRVQ